MLTSPQSGSNVENWPTLGRTRDFSFSTSDESTIRRLTNASNPRTNPNDQTDDDDSVDGRIDDIEATCAPPEYTASFGSAIAAALSNANHVKSSRKPIPVPNTGRNANSGGGGGKKKKNNNKTVLFSTGGRTFDGN